MHHRRSLDGAAAHCRHTTPKRHDSFLALLADFLSALRPSFVDTAVPVTAFHTRSVQMAISNQNDAHIVHMEMLCSISSLFDVLQCVDSVSQTMLSIPSSWPFWPKAQWFSRGPPKPLVSWALATLSQVRADDRTPWACRRIHCV